MENRSPILKSFDKQIAQHDFIFNVAVANYDNSAGSDYRLVRRLLITASDLAITSNQTYLDHLKSSYRSDIEIYGIEIAHRDIRKQLDDLAFTKSKALEMLNDADSMTAFDFAAKHICY